MCVGIKISWASGRLYSKRPSEVFATVLKQNLDGGRQNLPGAAAQMNTCCHGSLEQVQGAIDSRWVLNF